MIIPCFITENRTLKEANTEQRSLEHTEHFLNVAKFGARSQIVNSVWVLRGAPTRRSEAVQGHWV